MKTLLAIGLMSLIEGWAPTVHNQLLEKAFPDANLDCLLQMQKGSADADADRYQNVEFSYMHAMRMKGQDSQVASRKMRQFIIDNYAEAKRTHIEEERCYYRGFALHPIMDSTSPAHANFQEWDSFPYATTLDILRAIVKYKDSLSKLPKMLEHGDVATQIKNYTSLDVAESLEDASYANKHPKIIEATVELMRTIDIVYML